MRRPGFTLIELMILLVILGILAMVAVPRFLNLAAHARRDACKSALAEVRSAIEHYRARKSPEAGTPAAGGAVAAFPTPAELTTPGTILAGALPNNPYSTSAAGASKNVTVTGVSKGTVVTAGTAGAWAYNPATGEFWADTDSGANEAEY